MSPISLIWGEGGSHQNPTFTCASPTPSKPGVGAGEMERGLRPGATWT